MPVLQLLELVLFAFTTYLVGSICTAILVCMLLGLPDPRGQGSGNPGASNMLRLYGRLPALLTLAGDVLKGVLPVLVARELDYHPSQQGLLGCAAVIGHIFPIFFRFQGGKGVATAIGVLYVLSWQLGLALTGVWLAVLAVTRISAAGALVAGLTAPVLGITLFPDHLYTTLVLLGITILRHTDNIKRIFSGTEHRFGS